MAGEDRDTGISEPPQTLSGPRSRTEADGKAIGAKVAGPSELPGKSHVGEGNQPRVCGLPTSRRLCRAWKIRANFNGILT
jgi:hypothetical protein